MLVLNLTSVFKTNEITSRYYTGEGSVVYNPGSLGDVHDGQFMDFS